MMKLHDAHVAGRWPRRWRHRPWEFHVIPSGALCSLRRALLLWLVPLFLVVGVVSAAFSYWSYMHMVAEFMDNQMAQLGHSVRAQQGPLAPPPTTRERVHDWGDYVVQVWGPGEQLQGSSFRELAVPLQSSPGFADVRSGGTAWRVYTTEASEGTGRRVQVLQSGTFRAHLAAERAGAALAPVLVLLPLAFAVLWALSGAMSRAVQEIGRQAAKQDENSIEELSLDRVPAELKPMVESFNSLLTRLRDAFATQRRLVQDAAHELRTPITAVALQLENVRRDLPPGACDESFAQLQAGVNRATRVVDQLLKLSRQEAAAGESPTVVDLNEQVRESIAALLPLADQRRIDLGVADSEPVEARLRCSPGDLRSALDNLVENALRYTPEGGVVDVRVRSDGGRPVIEVVDSGPGIPPELLDRVFDRFFRVPGSTARGSGLGLAIAQSAAQRCGLRIVLRNRTDASGLVARLEVSA